MAEQALAGTTVTILAGGLGTRLRSVVPDCPKALAQVSGRPFLCFLLDQLVVSGISTVVLCTGHLGSQIRAALGDSYRGMGLMYSREFSPLGTGGALRAALPLVHSEEVLVMNGDSFCAADLNSFYRFHRESNANATLLLTQIVDMSRFGQVKVVNDGQIIGFEEKGTQKGSGWINAGVYLMSKYLLKSIPDGKFISLEHDIFPSWIGQKFFGYKSSGHFIDIGTPASYSEASTLFGRIFNMDT
jgi:D-glycero-alpha-D-manno-heptose 1-phosphate guanylyltransferase